jgi:hypothetical protein
MGGASYSLDVTRRVHSGGNNSAFQSAVAPAAHDVHAALNPFGKRPEVNHATPIIVALDVTRSRGDDTKLMYETLAQLMGQIELKGHVENPGISFCAIGDATCDRAPLQVSQFEGDNRLDEALGRIWIEEGGGGTGQESYELAAYFYSRTNCVRLAAGTGKKGYCFFVGDEGFHTTLDKATIYRVIGDKVSEDIPAAEAFRRLQEKFHAFLIYPHKTMAERRANIDAEIRDRVMKAGGPYDGVDIGTSLLWTADASDMLVGVFDHDPKAHAARLPESADKYARYADDVVLAQWATVIPKEHILRVGDPKSITDVLLGALLIADCKVDLDSYLKDMRELGSAEERVRGVEAALAGLPSAQKVAAAVIEGDLPAPPAPESRKKKTVRL